MLCSIEKGIIKRQLLFSIVKSCDEGVGSRFSISFKGYHDYELEATSVEEKNKVMYICGISKEPVICVDKCTCRENETCYF